MLKILSEVLYKFIEEESSMVALDHGVAVLILLDF